MKKLFAGILAIVLLGGTLVGAAACGGEQSDDLKVVAPDGAPALALCNAISQEEAKENGSFDFEIVNADKIITYVTNNDNSRNADICVLPVNAAAKVLGEGSVYQMLGTVTNGNLYILSFGETQLTAENFADSILGKKFGVIQLTNVPGLTLQVVLKQMDIEYRKMEEGSDGATEEDKANLIAITPDDVSPTGKCDFYLCPEPAASAKVKGSAASDKPLHRVGDLQELYGEEGGYPQAAVVVKKSVLRNRLSDVKTFLGYLEGSADYLETAEIPTLLRLLEEEREDGVTPSFSDKTLTREVIANCSVRFTASKDCKDKVVAFLDKLIGVDAGSAAKPEDEFFYMG